MAFDLAWDFRNTAGYVTDPAYAVFCAHNTAYPHTFTNGNGDSINGGWATAPGGSSDHSATVDARLAGINYRANDGGAGATFQVDLSSGSNPGAGTYQVDLAIGDIAGQDDWHFFQLLDNATVLIDGTNGGSGYNLTGGTYKDATLATVTASTTWTGTPATKTFASTTVNLVIGVGNHANFTRLSHFRLTLQGGAAAPTFRRNLSMLGTRSGTRQLMRP